MSLPIQIQKRFANPGQLENAFINFLTKANLPIQQSKTISSQVLYDAKRVDGFQSVELFTGNYDPARTNIEGDYVRPASEHFLIYGIMASYCTQTDAEVSNGQFQWKKGFTSDDAFADAPAVPFQNCQISLQTNSVQYLKRIPSTEWDGELKTDDSGWCKLNTPILWSGQTSLVLTIETNDQSITFPVSAGNQTFVRFDLYGIGLI